MDDSFAFRTTMPAPRRIEPRVRKATAVGTLLVLGVGLFANWVIVSERESLARAHRRETPAPEVTVGGIDGPTDSTGTDADAEASTRVAFAAARAAFGTDRGFLDAGPVQLSALQPGYTFVDGPSTTSTIVSVAAGRHAWAAAVLGSGGTCFWIRAGANGAVNTGTSSTCTGASVLAPRSPR
ncbi:MAG: hypothetical protein ACRDG8_03735 [Actinomycetota bacterium]